MAPEQLAGSGATAASDIYAFGIVLCEIVTGARPGTAGEIQGEELIEQRWAKVIRRCIERTPEKRFVSAGEAVAALERPSLPLSAFSKHHKRMLFSVAASMALAALITVAVLRWTLSKPSPPPGSALLLSDISNLTQDADISAVTELFGTELQQSSYLNLWDRRRLPAVFQRMGRTAGEPLNPTLAREVAYREGVPLVVSATIAPVGDQFTVSVLLEMLESGSPNVRARWQQSFQATGKNQLFGAVHEGCTWARRKIGERQADIAAHDRPPEDVTTTSWQALARYSEAEQFQAERQSDKAVQMLKLAVTFDQHFALGYMRLGDILMATRQQDQGFYYWRQALAEAGRGHLTRHEELRLRGLYDGDTWDWAGYEASFAQMEKEFPYDWLASFYLGDAYRSRGRLQEAVRAFERAASKTRDSIPIADNLGTVAMEINDPDRLRRETDRMRHLGHPEFADQIEGEAKFAQTDFAGAIDSFKRVEGADNPEASSRATWFEAAALAETAREPEAEAILRRGMDEDAKRGLQDAEIEKRLVLQR
jgi:tetratricopeptide (TPR) repeat protein